MEFFPEHLDIIYNRESLVFARVVYQNWAMHTRGDLWCIQSLKNVFYQKRQLAKRHWSLDRTFRFSRRSIGDYSMSAKPYYSDIATIREVFFSKSQKAYFFQEHLIIQHKNRKQSRTAISNLIENALEKAPTVSTGVARFKSCSIHPYNPSAIADCSIAYCPKRILICTT